MGNLVAVRRASAADAAELTRLRGLMHEAMGTDTSVAGWAHACEAAFVRRLERDDFAAFVVDGDARLLSCGVGWLEEHLPSPGQVDGRRGHIASMSSEPAARRQGHGRAVFSALMEWFAELDVSRVDLRATEDGRPLYEEFGFRVLQGPTMAWTRPGVRPGLGFR